MKRHVEFLSTLYLTWGAIFTLVALAGFALAGGAAAIATATGPVRIASEMAARLTAITIGIVSVIALIWGGLHLWIGRSLRQHLASARLMAAVEKVTALKVLTPDLGGEATTAIVTEAVYNHL